MNNFEHKYLKYKSKYLLMKAQTGGTKETLIIGITGASASGKSVFATKLAEQIGAENCILISQDMFYKTPPDGTDISKYNFDEPAAIDYELFNKCITELKETKKTNLPNYSFEEHRRLETTTPVNFEGCYIIIEGIFSLNNKELFDKMDTRIFIDTRLDMCLARRIERDVSERGRDVKGIINQYTTFVRPGYFNFIEPKKYECDIVVPNEKLDQYFRALNMVSDYLTLKCVKPVQCEK